MSIYSNEDEEFNNYLKYNEQIIHNNTDDEDSQLEQPMFIETIKSDIERVNNA